LLAQPGLPGKTTRRFRMTATLFIPCFTDALYPRAVEIACCGRPPFNSGYPSMISFITGPSRRTGDIERILVLGAHGPKRLTIFRL
jgi:hypothetical protein